MAPTSDVTNIYIYNPVSQDKIVNAHCYLQQLWGGQSAVDIDNSKAEAAENHKNNDKTRHGLSPSNE